jgi:hypothetical protein
MLEAVRHGPVWNQTQGGKGEMKKLVMFAAVVFLAVTMFSSVSEARRSMLDAVNLKCGTNYGCGLCHVDPKGGGPLTSAGAGYAASGNDSCYFCSTKCGGGTTCTDADKDGYYAEGGTCGTKDCNDAVSAINPAACDILNNGVDENCDGKDRTKGKPCR